MKNIAIVVGVLFAVNSSAWLLWKYRLLKGEGLRKYNHIVATCFIAFTPWLISWTAIRWIALIGIVAAAIEHKLNITHLGGDLKRRTYGAEMLGLGIIVCSLLTDQKEIFAMAILHVALADGFAALIGSQSPKKYRYKILGNTKSIMGTATFWLMSLAITGLGIMSIPELISYQNYIVGVAIIPITLALVENVSVWGTDNLTVPVMAVGLLTFLS